MNAQILCVYFTMYLYFVAEFCIGAHAFSPVVCKASVFNIHIEIKYYQEMNVKQESVNELVFCSFCSTAKLAVLFITLLFLNKSLHKNGGKYIIYYGCVYLSMYVPIYAC